MKFISIFLGKIVAYLCTLLGRGSSFPGTFAEKLDKNILKKITIDEIEKCAIKNYEISQRYNSDILNEKRNKFYKDFTEKNEKC